MEQSTCNKIELSHFNSILLSNAIPALISLTKQAVPNMNKTDIYQLQDEFGLELSWISMVAEGGHPNPSVPMSQCSAVQVSKCPGVPFSQCPGVPGLSHLHGGDGETHKGGTEKRTFFGTHRRTDGQTDRRTDTGSYRSGAHLKK